MGRFSVKKIRKLFIEFNNKLAWPGFLKDMQGRCINRK